MHGPARRKSMFSNGKIDFECIVPSYLQSRAEALFLIWRFDRFLFTFFLWHFQPEDVTYYHSCHRWQPISVFWFCFFVSLVISQLRGIHHSCVSFKIGANMNLAAANPGQSVLGDDPADWVVNFGFCLFFQCCQFWLLLFLNLVVAIFLFCWFWADFWLRAF